MPRFIEGQDRHQVTLVPESLDDFIADDNVVVRSVDAFVDELKLQALGFEGTQPAETGRPPYHPAVLLKIYIYGYLNACSLAVGSSASASAIRSSCGSQAVWPPTGGRENFEQVSATNRRGAT